jgi:hypothetical protein
MNRIENDAAATAAAALRLRHEAESGKRNAKSPA